MVVTGEAAFGVPPLTEMPDTTAGPVVELVPSAVVVVDSPVVVVEPSAVVVVEPPSTVVVVGSGVASITQVKPAGSSATSVVTTIFVFQYFALLRRRPPAGHADVVGASRNLSGQELAEAEERKARDDARPAAGGDPGLEVHHRIAVVGVHEGSTGLAGHLNRSSGAEHEGRRAGAAGDHVRLDLVAAAGGVARARGSTRQLEAELGAAPAFAGIDREGPRNWCGADRARARAQQRPGREREEYGGEQGQRASEVASGPTANGMADGHDSFS
jgi:hypothetical protein